MSERSNPFQEPDVEVGPFPLRSGVDERAGAQELRHSIEDVARVRHPLRLDFEEVRTVRESRAGQ